jgi:hypothetical protein
LRRAICASVRSAPPAAAHDLIERPVRGGGQLGACAFEQAHAEAVSSSFI